jgi:hypothetical protein
MRFGLLGPELIQTFLNKMHSKEPILFQTEIKIQSILLKIQLIPIPD